MTYVDVYADPVTAEDFAVMWSMPDYADPVTAEDFAVMRSVLDYADPVTAEDFAVMGQPRSLDAAQPGPHTSEQPGSRSVGLPS